MRLRYQGRVRRWSRHRGARQTLRILIRQYWWDCHGLRLTGRVGVRDLMSDYRSINTCKTDPSALVRNTCACKSHLITSPTYRPPRRKMPIICNFCFSGLCSFKRRGIGRIMITKSVSTLNAEMIVPPNPMFTQWWCTLGFQFESIGTHWKIGAKNETVQ